jgi:hypothetical protein
VSFLDKGAQISQVTTESSTSDSNAGCILFTSVANVDPTAQFTLEVDFDDDGTIDYVWTVPATQWQRVQVQITAPPAYDGIRFILTKGGTGNAVLAEMRAQTTTGCTAAPVPMPALSLGEPCTSDGDCSSGICAIALFCVGCSGPATVCSQCDYGRPCSAGEKCTGREYPTLASMPLQCAPGLNRGASGAECIADNDCESGQCTGAIATAPQASAAGGPPGPCDLDSVDVGPDNCVQYAVHGGKCN